MFCFFLLFYLPKNCKSQDFIFNTNRKQQIINFELVRNLIVIPIYINQKGPFNFILDTGVNPMVILDSNLKESLKVPFTRPVKVSGYGNFGNADAFIGSTDVKFGDASMENMPTVFLKEDHSTLSGFIGKKIYGLIGYNLFNSFIVKVNYDLRTIKLSSPSKKVKFKGEKIDLTFIDNKPYTTLKVAQEGFIENAILSLIDCGANHAISLETINKKQFPLPKENIDADLGTGLTGKIIGKVGRVTSLKLGSFIFKDAIASYPIYNIDSTYNKERNANLGAEILSRFTITYDYRNKAMYLKKNSRYKNSFEHDMSGISLYTESGPPSKRLINKIDDNSPAQNAGLQIGDEIIGINFKNVDDLTLTEISDILKGKNGSGVVVEVWRKNATLVKLLKLKKRI